MLKLIALFLFLFIFVCSVSAEDHKETLFLLDRTGKEIKSLPMANACTFSEGSAEFDVRVSPEAFISGIIDSNGDFILPVEHKACDSFHEGLAWVVKADGKKGYIRRDGSWAFMLPEGFGGQSFSELLAVVGLQPNNEHPASYGYVDSTGSIVITPQFNGACSFHDGLAAVSIGREYHYIDKTGKQVGGTYAYAGDFSEGLGPVNCLGTGCWGRHGPSADYQGAGFVDTKGQISITPAFYQVTSFSDGMAAVKQNGKWGFIDRSGQMVIKPSFDGFREFSDGLCPVYSQAADKWGYIDKHGEFVIPQKFQQAESLSDGLAKVQIGGKFGFIDKTGKFVIEPKYSWCRNFQCERAFATR